MKRVCLPSSSEDSDDNGSLSTSWSQHSRFLPSFRHEDRKPSEVFRTDLITAMKLHDSNQLNPEDYYVLADPWRQEWEKGVQVPVNPEFIPETIARVIAEKDKVVTFTRPRKYIHSSGSEPPEVGYVDIQTLADAVCRYDLNEMDVAWLQLINEEFKEMGMQQLDEYTMEQVLEEFEKKCYDKMNHAIETEEGLGIEYDEDVVCDVCQSPDGEDGNEMVFCDKCNICVHQACYGILKVPEGSWLCRTCALGVQPKCLLCPKKGGAMKPTRSGTKWVHVSCALWIPEVSIGSPEKMEPITKVSHIPSNRWALLCSLCNEKVGACIQVRNLTYMVTRREKMKRSVCRVQEQIFNLYTKISEQEKDLGFPLENGLLFNTQPSNPDAPKIEDLKWHSAFFRKRLGSSLRCSMKDSHKKSRERIIGKSLDTEILLTDRKKEGQTSDVSFPLEKTVAKIKPVQQKNGGSFPEHRKRRDSRTQGDTKFDSKEKPLRQQHRPAKHTEPPERPAEKKRALSQCGGKSATASSNKKQCSSSLPRYSGSLIKIHCNRPSVKVPTSPIKNWGGFRIPKKGEKVQPGSMETCQPNLNCQFLGQVSKKGRTKEKVKLDNDNDGYTPDAEMSDSESEPTDKCRLQRLTSSSSLSRGYETDFIRRSILAS
ncbi:protein Jade-1 isoform X1 [Xenopus laevis]|uniref:Protein Jade-1 n=1 Tax=Xenopus laevis TaxID=8355 RepID=A0A8J0TXU0_XENLA|nr:protein Jade-1 isoform X1 [Xenopus laevis]